MCLCLCWCLLASLQVFSLVESSRIIMLDSFIKTAGHLMEKIEAENLLHRAFSVFLFNSKYELLLQVICLYDPSPSCDDDS